LRVISIETKNVNTQARINDYQIASSSQSTTTIKGREDSSGTQAYENNTNDDGQTKSYMATQHPNNLFFVSNSITRRTRSVPSSPKSPTCPTFLARNFANTKASHTPMEWLAKLGSSVSGLHEAKLEGSLVNPRLAQAIMWSAS